MTPEAVILVADTHVNSLVGLCLPEVAREEGTTHLPNPTQRWMYASWLHAWDWAWNLTEGYHRTTVTVGDVVELDKKHNSNQVITKNDAKAREHCQNILDPIAQRSDTFMMIRGTEAHTGPMGSGEEEIAKDLGAEMCPETGTHSWWHLRARFGGVLFDLAHHASMGGLPWTYANAAHKIRHLVIMKYAEWGEAPPDIIARAHNHRWADTGETYKERAICLPCWQWKTSFLYRVGKENDKPHIGLVVFLIDNGNVIMKKKLLTPKRSLPWSRKSQSLVT